MHDNHTDREDEPVPDSSDGRRSFLKKVGIGAAVAWTAPVLASGPASAGPGTGAGACPGPMDWGSTVFTRADVGTITTGLVPTAAYPLTYTNLGTTFSLGMSDPSGAYLPTGGFGSGIDGTFARTGQPFSYHCQMGGTGTGAGPITLTLSFSPAVTNVSFTVLDVDTNTTLPGYIDRINVTAVDSLSNNSPGTASAVTDPPVLEEIADVQFVGTANVPNTGSTAGDVSFNFPGNVATVTIVYSRAGTNTTQGIGISDITCS